MKCYIIDTNCLISYTTTRNKAQSEKISFYIEDASNLKSEIMILSNIITEFVYTLQTVYRVDSKSINCMLCDLLKNPGIQYHHGYFISNIFSFWPDKIKDYGDAVLAAAALELKTPVLTFDKPFTKQMSLLNIPHKLL
ncbi:MAG: PIN domain-containing protein [Candidatus Scalindua sp. AMX11]|nr:MAG: PIN domain-containing protein [Candidatus Scalindua sp.]NOG82212.1 PIN domain-containing protein [Planctomycetota bacterium]RZV65495.1 MAG: PIN domain-containing protein [Candidatus Scalindua sp. SCAELEC01]TDE63219.1 MAG: PIN domain-containing protein [Candidatus Scalindua sp. AMX11]NOG84186.1 PIN domain-containing protein [Planctomycetota bacterium]